MRIISGNLKARKLHRVRGMGIRPTADRLRESVFNILSSDVREAVVLDMFAGTGAFGIEALSRGAAFSVFIDKSEQALSLIGQNIRSFGLESRTKVIKWDIKKNLNCIRSQNWLSSGSKEGTLFDLIFMDPPYNKNLIRPALCNLINTRSLATGAIIVIEHSESELIPDEYAIVRQRKYGKTLVSFLIKG